MAKFVHYAPLNMAGKISVNGLRKSTAKHRAIGVYATPCTGLEPTATTEWSRMLKNNRRKTRRVAVIFEIPDHELVHCYENWGDNMDRGNRDLTPASRSETVAHNLARKNDGRIDGMEVVVPRHIDADEVVTIVLPVNKKKSGRAARRNAERRMIAADLSGE